MRCAELDAVDSGSVQLFATLDDIAGSTGQGKGVQDFIGYQVRRSLEIFLPKAIQQSIQPIRIAIHRGVKWIDYRKVTSDQLAGDGSGLGSVLIHDGDATQDEMDRERIPSVVRFAGSQDGGHLGGEQWACRTAHFYFCGKFTDPPRHPRPPGSDEDGDLRLG